MSLHETLMSMKPISNITHGFCLKVPNQSKFLFVTIKIPRQKSMIKTVRSMELPSSMVAPPLPNQIPKGLLVVKSKKMVGIHKDKDAFGNCLRSSLNKNSTNIVQSVRATIGGIKNDYRSTNYC